MGAHRRWLMLVMLLSGCELDAEPRGACGLAAADRDDALAVAACRAVEPFARGDFTMPVDLLLGDITARRFRVTALGNLWPAYQRALADEPTTQLRVYARLGDAAAQVTAMDLAALQDIDSYTGPALHCAQHALPGGYADQLAENAAAGRYRLTHVLMALIMLGDQGCQPPTDDAFYESVVADTAALIDTTHSFTSDLELEAAAFLAYVGEAQRIPVGFLEGVIASQSASGGWSALGVDGEVNGHTSGLALWYLHEILFPGSTHPMVTPDVRAP